MDVFATSTTALVSQVGGRHLSFQFTDAQKKLLQHPYGQMLILYTMFYISTRSLLVSLVLILLYMFLVNVLLNEKNPWNIFSREWLKKEGFMDGTIPKKSHMYRENLSLINKI